MLFRKLPVFVRHNKKDIYKADLMKELRINRHKLDEELLLQPGRYVWWATLYAEFSKTVAYFQEKLDQMEARLYMEFSSTGASRKKIIRVRDLKQAITLDPEYMKLKKKLRQYQDAERFLKYAEKGFQQRLNSLQTVSANVRREWNADGPDKKREE